jgi:hypothetical protein
MLRNAPELGTIWAQSPSLLDALQSDEPRPFLELIRCVGPRVDVTGAAVIQDCADGSAL